MALPSAAAPTNVTHLINGSVAAEDCRHGQVVSVPDGQPATVSLQVTADPCPTVTWMYNGSEIVFDENNTLQELGASPCLLDTQVGGTFRFTLIVLNVTEGEGYYAGRFKNQVGEDTSDNILVTPNGEYQGWKENYSSHLGLRLKMSGASIKVLP